MKTSLIHVSPTADWRAAVARVRGGRQGRVILVWPAKGGPRNARLVLRLMQRRSLRLGVPLAVVASNAYLRAETEKLGLPIFANTRQARDVEWGLSQAALAPSKPATRLTAASLRAKALIRRAAFMSK
jgi:hypothetical protein